ncbi:hypothetical protein HYV69_03120 [Candidatus Uhrbacteria bacterium]|nr:hypothetical protein [Candidatus Uhrbacteria bacterium]
MKGFCKGRPQNAAYSFTAFLFFCQEKILPFRQDREHDLFRCTGWLDVVYVSKPPLMVWKVHDNHAVIEKFFEDTMLAVLRFAHHEFGLTLRS